MSPAQKAFALRLVDQLAQAGQVVLEAGTTRVRCAVQGWDFERDELVLTITGEQSDGKPRRRATGEERVGDSPASSAA
jgi:hypothetical protein